MGTGGAKQCKPHLLPAQRLLLLPLLLLLLLPLLLLLLLPLLLQLLLLLLLDRPLMPGPGGRGQAPPAAAPPAVQGVAVPMLQPVPSA